MLYVQFESVLCLFGFCFVFLPLSHHGKVTANIINDWRIPYHGYIMTYVTNSLLLDKYVNFY